MDKLDLWKKAANLRRQLGEDATSPIDIFSLAHSVERLSIVFYPMGDHLSGMCIKCDNDSVIAINSTMSVGRQRFSMAHEFFHLFFDDDAQSTTVCAKGMGVGTETEKQADQFASYFLMPPDALTNMIESIMKNRTDRLSVKDVVRLEQHFKVSRQAILFRLLEEGVITKQEAELMRRGVILSATNLGYSDTLYKPLPAEKQHRTYGFYIQQTDEAFNKGLISSGKYEELLMDAYRSDLVYGAESEGGELID
jgi:Zn-dependent peptidase ImmA (M78 family)